MKWSPLGMMLIFLAVLLPAGCDRPEQKKVVSGSVKANAAFREHFGEPPLPAQGTCYALVGYYPLAGDSTRVRAVPFFVFRENGQLSLLLERLVEPGWDFFAQGNLQNPFPPGSRVGVVGQTNDSVTIDLILPEGGEVDPELVIASLVETALQFPELKRVFITINGTLLAAMPEEGFTHETRRIAPAGPPLPLMVVGSWEEKELEEILVNFDRPVVIRDFRLTDAAGREVKGDYYRAGFDMAVVVHPAEPGDLQEGMVLTVTWNVVDRLNRQASGKRDFTLLRRDHEHQ
jgi:hypothetical protein